MKPTTEDLRVATEVLDSIRKRFVHEGAVKGRESSIADIASAIAAEREKAWNDAIMFVNIVDIGDAKGADATYKIGKMLEAAAGDKE